MLMELFSNAFPSSPHQLVGSLWINYNMFPLGKKITLWHRIKPSLIPASVTLSGARWDEHSSGKVTDVREHPQAKLSTDTPLLG